MNMLLFIEMYLTHIYNLNKYIRILFKILKIFYSFLQPSSPARQRDYCEAERKS